MKEKYKNKLVFFSRKFTNYFFVFYKTLILLNTYFYKGNNLFFFYKLKFPDEFSQHTVYCTTVVLVAKCKTE